MVSYYNIFANELSKEIVNNGFAKEACVNIISQIGKPINKPQILDIKVKEKLAEDGIIKNLSKEMLRKLPNMWKKFISGELEIA